MFYIKSESSVELNQRKDGIPMEGQSRCHKSKLISPSQNQTHIEHTLQGTKPFLKTCL